MRRETQTIQQVGTGVCDCQINGLLRPCNHNRSAVILDQIGQSRSCIRHGIGSVAKHKSVVKLIFRFDQSGKLQPVACAHICAVQCKRLYRINGTESPCLRDAEICGARPSAVYLEAMVPPVAMRSIFFMLFFLYSDFPSIAHLSGHFFLLSTGSILQSVLGNNDYLFEMYQRFLSFSIILPHSP